MPKDAALDTTFPGFEAGMVPNLPGQSYEAAGTALEVSFEEGLGEAAEYYDEWPLVEKIELVGQPFVILKVDAFEGMSADGIAYNIKCVLKPDSSLIARIGGDHFSFNDGSTGVYTQLRGIMAKMDTPRPILVKGGLRISRYLWSEVEQKIVDAKGPKVVEQQTFYLCSSPETALKSLTK